MTNPRLTLTTALLLSAPALAQTGALADVSFFEFGEGIGASGLHVSVAGGATEVVLGTAANGFGRGNAYWFVMRHDATTGGLAQVFVSPVYPPSGLIHRLEVADATPDAGPEIVVARADRRIEIWNQATRTLLSSFQSAATAVDGLAVVDVDGDQQVEVLVSAQSGGLWVHAVDGSLVWSTTAVGGSDVVAGQMDGDAAVEIATTDGNVIDFGTRTVQWSWPATFAADLDLADIDGDGYEELLTSGRAGFIWSYDVDTGLPKWSIPVREAVVIEAANIDSDPAIEVLVGEGQWGDTQAFDTVTRQQEFRIRNPEHGTTRVTHGDVDGDGQLEVLWGAGYTSTGQDNLFVGDPGTQAIEWQSEHLDGPFLGPVRGDLDGDGTPELVTLSTASRAGYGGPRLVVLDDADLAVRALSSPLSSSGFSSSARMIALHDLDRDGDQEVIAAVGSIVALDYGPQGFSTLWTMSSSSFGSAASFAIGDLDGDGREELYVGATQFLIAFDLATRAELWRSFYLGPSVTQVALGDTDGDGQPEVHALSSDGDVYVFGPTGTAEAALFHAPSASFVEVSVLDLGGLAVLATGAADGALTAYANPGTGYVRIGPVPFAGTSIDGLLFLPPGLFVVGAGGTLRIHDGLRPAWTSAPYGDDFGATPLFVGRARTLYAAGEHGVVGFRF